MQKLDFIWKEAEGLPRKQTTREVLQCAHCAHPDLYSTISFDNPHYNSVRITCDLCGSNICASAKDVDTEELIDDCVKRWNRRDPEYVEPELVLWYNPVGQKMPKEGKANGNFFLAEEWSEINFFEIPEAIKIKITKSQLKRMEELAQTVREKDVFNINIIGGNLFYFELFGIKDGELVSLDGRVSFDYSKTTIYERLIEVTLTFEDSLEITIPLGEINHLKELFRCQK